MNFNLPHVGVMNTEQLPENFDVYVKVSFQTYSQTTARAYQHEDKLSYIDLMRKEFWQVKNAREIAIKTLMDWYKRFARQKGKYGVVDPEQVCKFGTDCVEAGFLPLCGNYARDQAENEQARKVLFRIIYVVTNYLEG